MGNSVEKFYNPVTLHIGRGAVELVKDIKSASDKILIVTSSGFSRRGMAGRVAALCAPNQCVIYDEVTPNPELDDLEHMISAFANQSFSLIIALGGGSVLDAAKVLAAMIPAKHESPLTKIFRDGQTVSFDEKLPLLAIPTTSGTGSEVTPFATVWDSQSHKKYSLAGSNVFPDQAILDPTLTLTLPHGETLTTALDAISHALESIWNKGKTSISEIYAIEALRIASRALPELMLDLNNLESREAMQRASLYAGLAISQTKTAIAHSISYPLTSYFGVPHGLACSFTLPTIIEFYLANKVSEPHRGLLLNIKDILISMNLDELLKQYCNVDQLKDILNEMYTPERAANFSFDIDAKILEKLVLDSALRG